MFCVSVGPKPCSRRTSGSLDGRLAVADSNAGLQPFGYRSVRYWSKEINGTLLGAKKIFF